MLFHKPTRSFTRKETAFFFAQKTQARIIPPHLRLRARMLLVTHPQRASSHSSIRQHVITTRTLTCWTALLTVLTLNTTQDPQSGQDSKDTMVDVVKRNMDTKSEGEGDATEASMSVLSADAGVTSVSGSTTAATHLKVPQSAREMLLAVWAENGRAHRETMGLYEDFTVNVRARCEGSEKKPTDRSDLC
jgi:hypothetical protein